jgi:cytochrome P450
LAVEDFEVNDFLIKKEDRLLLCLASSNRDPLAFKNPSEVYFEKRKNTHLAFTKGQYYCTGAQISLDVISSFIKRMSSSIHLFENKDLIYKRNTFLILT